LRHSNPDTVGLGREEKRRESLVVVVEVSRWGEGGRLATQSEKKREQEVIFVKVDAT
jgi:hypothetical protein